MIEITIYMASENLLILKGDNAIEFKRMLDADSKAPIRIDSGSSEYTIFRQHIEMIEVINIDNTAF